MAFIYHEYLTLLSYFHHVYKNHFHLFYNVISARSPRQIFGFNRPEAMLVYRPYLFAITESQSS